MSTSPSVSKLVVPSTMSTTYYPSPGRNSLEKRIAAPMIAGMPSATLLTLSVISRLALG